jgi:hypothetical protein
LSDVSADSNSADVKGAMVQGVIAASENGTSVYFAALGQLIPGEGKTYAQNTSGTSSANVYLSESGVLRYVTTLGMSDLKEGGGIPGSDLVRAEGNAMAEATPDGKHLIFTSQADITGYESGGFYEAYIYSEESGTVQCISCRRDGQPSVGPSNKASTNNLALSSAGEEIQVEQTRTRRMSNDGSVVFFKAPDVLALGAVSGNNNIYEWQRGQVFLLATGPEAKEEFGDGSSVEIFGATPSGDDVFIRSASKLVPQDVDSVADIYDARVDGGFAPPEPELEPCNPEVNCRGAALVAPLASSPASAVFSGGGNQPGVVVSPEGKSLTTVKSLTRAQKLAKALKACRAKPEKQRAGCEKQAEGRYGPQKKKRAASKGHRKVKKPSGRVK